MTWTNYRKSFWRPSISHFTLSKRNCGNMKRSWMPTMRWWCPLNSFPQKLKSPQLGPKVLWPVDDPNNYFKTLSHCWQYFKFLILFKSINLQSSKHSVHSTHSTHSAHSAHASHTSRTSWLFFFLIYDHALSCWHKSTYWGGIFQSHSHNLFRVNDPSGDQVCIFTFAGVKTEWCVFAFKNFFNNIDSLESCIISNSFAWECDGLPDDFNTQILLWVLSFQVVKGSGCI